jgi:Protein of unknown function (DUF2786)
VGVNNRQRRKAKQKARQEQQRARAQVGEMVFGAGMAVEAAVHVALHSKAHGHEAELERIIARLCDPRVKPVVDLVLSDGLQEEICQVWQRGWQPADLMCAAGRSISTDAQSLLIDMVAAQMRQYARATVDESWEQQLAVLGAAVWWQRDELYFDGFAAPRSLSRVDTVRCAIDVLNFLTTLPQLPQLCPPPGRARRGSLATMHAEVDTRALQRVRALLAKAEATDFPEEAETYTAKAQELMTRHSIDYAMLGAAKVGGKEEPVGRRVAVDNPYEAPKAILLDVTATANCCHAVWSRTFGFSTIVGFAADVAAAELLFTSLLLQATTAMRAAGSAKDGRTTSFRRSFLTAYANRIGQRLHQASKSAIDNAIHEYGGNLLPVLASRADSVKVTFDQMFPSLTEHELSAPTNRQGWIAGLAAADRAKLDQQLELEFN